MDPSRFYITGLSMGAAGHKVVRFVSETLLPAPGLNTCRDAIRSGRTRESLLSNKSNITWDSLARAARGGAKHLYSELTGGDHRSGWMIAWHNPLLAEWDGRAHVFPPGTAP